MLEFSSMGSQTQNDRWFPIQIQEPKFQSNSILRILQQRISILAIKKSRIVKKHKIMKLYIVFMVAGFFINLKSYKENAYNYRKGETTNPDNDLIPQEPCDDERSSEMNLTIGFS